MVCPNCKHELNPQARVCPTCGTPVPGAPIVVVTPPRQSNALPAPKQKKTTGARVFAVIFMLLAAAANAALAWLWFWPTVPVVDNAGPNSASFAKLSELAKAAAPWLTYVLIAACVLGVIFCLIPVFRKGGLRRRLLIPKLMAVVSAGCYVALFTYYAAAPVACDAHCNFFTAGWLGLAIVLFIGAELTIRDRHVIQNSRVQALEAQLASYGLEPEV